MANVNRKLRDQLLAAFDLICPIFLLLKLSLWRSDYDDLAGHRELRHWVS